MKRVKGITKTSLIHNGKLYEPNQDIDISVDDNDYSWLVKNFVTISQTQETAVPEPIIKKEEKPSEMELPKMPNSIRKPDLSKAKMQKPTLK